MTRLLPKSSRPFWLSAFAALAVLVPALGCSDGGGNSSCPDTAERAQALEAQCVGSAKSCSSISIYTSEGKKACAYQDGCELSYDYNDCRGSATQCAGLSEVYCGHQIGCTWQTTAGGSAGSGGGGNPGGPPSSTTTEPCASASGGASGGSGTAGAPASTGSSGGSGGGGTVPEAGSTSDGGSGGSATLPEAGSTTGGGPGSGTPPPSP